MHANNWPALEAEFSRLGDRWQAMLGEFSSFDPCGPAAPAAEDISHWLDRRLPEMQECMRQCVAAFGRLPAGDRPPGLHQQQTRIAGILSELARLASEFADREMQLAGAILPQRSHGLAALRLQRAFSRAEVQ